MADGDVIWDDEVQWDEPASGKSGIGQAYESYARPLYEAAQRAANNLVRAPYEILTGQRPLITGVQAPPEYQTPPESPLGQIVAGAINPVPPTLPAAGATLGMWGLGPFGPLARIGGAALGAGFGAELEGQPFEEQVGEAGKTGTAVGIGEAIGAGLSKLARSLPNNPLFGGKANIAAQDAAKYGSEMGENVPALAGARTAEDLRLLAAGSRDVPGSGLYKLGEMKAQAVRQIEGITGNAPFTVQGQNMTLQEANDLLSEIGARAFSRNPLDRTFNGIDQRRLYGDVLNDIKQGLTTTDPSGVALSQFERVQALYQAGRGYLDPLKNPQAFRSYEDQIQFNTPFFQKILGSPRGEASLRKKLGDAEFERLRDALLRGGAPGTTDVLPRWAGNISDPVAQLFRSGGGATTGLLALPRTLLPNLGGGYAGRAPYSLSPGGQATLNTIGLDLFNLGR